MPNSALRDREGRQSLTKLTDFISCWHLNLSIYASTIFYSWKNSIEHWKIRGRFFTAHAPSLLEHFKTNISREIIIFHIAIKSWIKILISLAYAESSFLQSLIILRVLMSELFIAIPIFVLKCLREFVVKIFITNSYKILWIIFFFHSINSYLFKLLRNVIFIVLRHVYFKQIFCSFTSRRNTLSCAWKSFWALSHKRAKLDVIVFGRRRILYSENGTSDPYEYVS